MFGSIGAVGLRASAVRFGECRAALDGEDSAMGWVQVDDMEGVTAMAEGHVWGDAVVV